MKRTFNLFFLLPLMLGFPNFNENPKLPQTKNNFSNQYRIQLEQDTLKTMSGAPSDLIMTELTGPDLTPSPACLAVAPTGEVYVGVDMIGPLGRDMGKGFIRRFVDSDNDGSMDEHTDYEIGRAH